MGTQWSILVVDDEPNFSRVLEAKLSRSGYSVSTAPDAATALRIVRDSPIHLVLLDLRLPDANGISILPRIRLLTGGTPVMLMTAYEQEGLRARGLLAGAADVLYKPFDLDQLVGKVSRLLGASARLEPLRLGQTIDIWPSGAPELHTVARVVRKAPDTILISPEEPGSIPTGPIVVEIAGEDGLYSFDTAVTHVDEDGRAVVQRPSVIRRNQRRRHSRVPFSAKVTLARSGGEVAALGAGLDICEGGISVVADRELPVGEPIEAAFDLPDVVVDTQTSVRAQARVVRVSEIDGERSAVCHMAVQFTALPKPAEAGIREYVRQATSI